MIESYTSVPLFQWDLNQVYIIENPGFEEVPIVHVGHLPIISENRAYKVEARLRDGKIEIPIPNQVLEKSGTIVIWVGDFADGSSTTRFAVNVPVIRRSKPDEYIEPDRPVFSYVSDDEINEIFREYLEFLNTL